MRAALLYRYRYLLALGWLGLTLALLPPTGPALQPDNALQVWFLKTDPAMQAYERFHALFGNDEALVLALDFGDSLFTPAGLAQLYALDSLLAQVPGVAEVQGLPSLQLALPVPGGLTALPLLPPQPPTADSTCRALRPLVLSHRLAQGRLIDSTGRITLLLVQMAVLPDIDAQRDRIVAEVIKTAQAVPGPAQVHPGGFGLIYAALNALTQRDFGLFLGLSYLFMFGLMGWLYRRWQVLLLAFLSLVSATVLTLGVYGLMGHQVNLLTVVIPVLLVILGLMDLMHLVHAYRWAQAQAGPETPAGQIVAAALARVWKPCLFTTLTTMAGFLALAASPMAVLREFGLYAALGMLASLLSAYAYAPLLLSWLAPRPLPLETGWGKRWASRLPDQVYRYRRLWQVAGATLVLLIVLGLSRLKVDTFTLGYLPDDHPVTQDHQWMEAHWGPYFQLTFLLQAPPGGSLQSPEAFAAMRRFEAAARQLEGVRDVAGPHTLYDYLYEAAGRSPSPANHRFVTRQLARQDSLLLRSWLGPDGTYARLVLTGPLLSADSLGRQLARLQAMGDSAFAGTAVLQPTGYPTLYAHIVDYVMQSQIRSFFLALLLVGLLMLLWLRRWRLALLAMVPNLLPMLVALGLMGLAGIPLDIATASVTAMVLGMSIDDTIHLLYRYLHHRQAGSSPVEATRQAFGEVAPVVLHTSLILGLGFLILLFASVKTLFYFGLLAACAVAGALLGDLVWLPLLLLRGTPATPEEK